MKFSYLFLLFILPLTILYSQIKVVDGSACVGCLDPEIAKLKTQGSSQLEFAVDALTGNADFTYQINSLTKGQIRYNVTTNTPGITYNLDNSNTGIGGIPNSRSALFLNANNLFVGINTQNPNTTLDVNGNLNYSGTLTNTSDKRLKQNIQTFSIGLDALLGLRPITYNYNEKTKLTTTTTHIGITAQNLQEVAPSLVQTWEYIEYAPQTQEEIDAELPEKVIAKEEYLKINDGAIKYIIINAIQEQQQLIKQQNKLIEKQQQQIADLKARLDALEK